MTVSLYQTGVSGLLSAQQQLATTGHNISNVNTEGYNRQRAEQNAAVGLNNGDNYIGSGTYIQDITRLYDQFSYKEQLLNQSNLGSANSLHNKLTQLDQIMSSAGGTLSESIQNFYQGMNGVADNPSDPAIRSIVLNQAGILSNDFSELQANFVQMQKAVNGEIEQIASKVSEISLELAKINETILHSQNNSQTGKPNDLLDKRDQLVGQLGEFTSVNTIQDTHGVMTVMIGNGATLVAGITPLTVSVQAGDPDPLQTQLQINSRNGSVAIDASKLGGAIAAKMEYRDEHLMSARSEINRLAMAISNTLNEAQAQGLDLDAQQGREIFTDINSSGLQAARVLEHTTNAGNLSGAVNITDVSLVPTDEFEVKFDGTDYIMTNNNNGTETNLGAPGSGTYATAFGFEFNELSGTPATNDKFTIRPTENSASLIKVTLTDSKGIAASAAVDVNADANNVSDGAVNIINVTDPVIARAYTEGSNTKLTVDVYESAPGTFDYRVYDAANPPPAPVIASGNFAAGASAVIDMPPAPATAAFQIEITGAPVGQGSLAREKFTISDVFGPGNGSNAGFISATQEQAIVGNGTQTFSQGLAVTTADIGSKASSAELVANTAQALFTQAYNRNQSTSGVNLDEEAANMIKFQQAYQASSRIISVANTIFDTLLAAV